MRTNDDQKEKAQTEKKKKKKGVLFFINGESAARHTLKKRRNSCSLSLYPSIAFVCMLGCEVACKPTNQNEPFVRRREQ
jgi:hypothetical protein